MYWYRAGDYDCIAVDLRRARRIVGRIFVGERPLSGPRVGAPVVSCDVAGFALAGAGGKKKFRWALA